MDIWGDWTLTADGLTAAIGDRDNIYLEATIAHADSSFMLNELGREVRSMYGSSDNALSIQRHNAKKLADNV